MAPIDHGSLGLGDALRLSDPALLRLQKIEARNRASTTAFAAADASCAPGSMQWRKELLRLQPFETDLALLPVGWGSERKGPMLKGWQHHGGFTVEQLLLHRQMRSVGTRTGLLTIPLLTCDFDGRTSFKLGLDPGKVGSWQVHRSTDPWRLKVLFRPTQKQLSQLPGGAEFHGKTITATKTNTNKAEALEVFFDGGRQVIVLGEHPSSGGFYYWPRKMGPEDLAPPPESWWTHALEIAHQCYQNKNTGRKPSHNRHNTRRLNPCPICGRHNGFGGSALWCEKTHQGLILCMPGTTFSAEGRHGPLRIGQVVDGWALVKRTPYSGGEVLTFKAHRPKGVTHG